MASRGRPRNKPIPPDEELAKIGMSKAEWILEEQKVSKKSANDKYRLKKIKAKENKLPMESKKRKEIDSTLLDKFSEMHQQIIDVLKSKVEVRPCESTSASIVSTITSTSIPSKTFLSGVPNLTENTSSSLTTTSTITTAPSSIENKSSSTMTSTISTNLTETKPSDSTAQFISEMEELLLNYNK
jgi:hypothetical protein